MKAYPNGYFAPFENFFEVHPRKSRSYCRRQRCKHAKSYVRAAAVPSALPRIGELHSTGAKHLK